MQFIKNGLVYDTEIVDMILNIIENGHIIDWPVLLNKVHFHDNISKMAPCRILRSEQMRAAVGKQNTILKSFRRTRGFKITKKTHRGRAWQTR